MILGAGRATLELSNAAQRDLIDSVEVGHPGVAPPMRVCFEVDDAAAVAATGGGRGHGDRGPDRNALALLERPTPGSGGGLNSRSSTSSPDTIVP